MLNWRLTAGGRRTAAAIAYACAALNAAAGLTMLLVLRPGLPVGPGAAERAAYIAGHLAAWRTGWLLWHAAALSLVCFYAALGAAVGRRTPWLATLAAGLAFLGLAPDLAAETVHMAVLPALGPGPEFTLMESLATALTGYLANGLYTLGGTLMTVAAAREPAFPRALVVLSVPVWLAGYGLSAAALAGSGAGMFWSTAVLMPGFVLWSAAVGRWLGAGAPVTADG